MTTTSRQNRPRRTAGVQRAWTRSSRTDVTSPMPSAPFRTLDDVVNGLSQLESELRDRRDRRCMFLTLYRVVSSEMRSQVAAGNFDDPEWVHRYAVAFANLYR